jgi:hypothetical protein
MKTLIILVKFPVAAILLFSCTRYQYSIIDSTLARNDQGEIFIENDTVSVTYRFSGPGGPVRLQIYNKLNTPLFLNWAQSALVINGTAINQWNDALEIKVISDGADDHYEESEESGILSRVQPVGYIPPFSSIESNPIRLGSEFFRFTPGKFKKTRLLVGGSRYNARSIFFTKENSPVRLSSHLTLSTTSDFSDVFRFNNEFWVKEVSQSMIEPHMLDKYAPRHDRYHNERMTVFGGLVVTTAAVGYLTLKVALELDDE